MSPRHVRTDIAMTLFARSGNVVAIHILRLRLLWTPEAHFQCDGILTIAVDAYARAIYINFRAVPPFLPLQLANRALRALP